MTQQADYLGIDGLRTGYPQRRSTRETEGLRETMHDAYLLWRRVGLAYLRDEATREEARQATMAYDRLCAEFAEDWDTMNAIDRLG